MSEQKKLVEVQHLQQYFNAGGFGKNRRYVQAVDDVSFFINKGETPYDDRADLLIRAPIAKTLGKIAVR